MGLDAVILFQQEGDEELDWGVPPDFSVLELPQNNYYRDDVPEATHELNCHGDRFYRIGYERGPWPKICAALMALHASAGVKKIWYGSDCCEHLEECPPERILEISKHYMEHGRRPYFNPVPAEKSE